MFGQKRLNPRIVGSMLGQHSPRLTPGAAAERQEVEICTTSSILKNCFYHEERKAGGNRVEHSDHRFWPECSDKGPSTQHLRPKIRPIYHLFGVTIALQPRPHHYSAQRGQMAGQASRTG